MVKEAKQQTVLIVDDEADICQLLVDEFQAEGYRVFSASNGKQALQFILKKSVDVIISDVKMPDGDGYWLLNQINKFVGKRPLFFFVTSTINHSKEEIQKMGALEVFLKPYDFHALLNTVDLHLSNVTSQEEELPEDIE